MGAGDGCARTGAPEGYGAGTKARRPRDRYNSAKPGQRAQISHSGIDGHVNC